MAGDVSGPDAFSPYVAPPLRKRPPFPPPVLETLSSLVDQNLVIERRRPDGDLRFGLLETIREFALEQLAASGEEAAVRDAHAAYSLELAERAREEFKGPDQASVAGADRRRARQSARGARLAAANRSCGTGAAPGGSPLVVLVGARPPE